MFCDIKDQLDNPIVRQILSCCLWDKSPKGVDEALRRYSGEQFYGWTENDQPLGVCGFRVLQDKVEICHISVTENARGKGVGSAMVTALQEKYEMPIEAETDDDAVEFYRKRGFVATAFYKYSDVLKLRYRRYACVLVAPKAPDHETEEELHARIYPIILCEYNPAWPEWFTEEKANLERLISAESIARINHYGSTSVPGLLAKPTIDILLEINESTDVNKLIASMPSPDYICLSGAGLTMPTPPPHLTFIKGYLSDGFAERVYHIHVVYPGDHDELRFRDYLIAHPETAAEYAELKRGLFQEYEHDRDGYTEAKGEFVRKIVQKAKEEREC